MTNRPKRFSFPKEAIKVLLLESINKSAVKYFQDEGYQVEYLDHGVSTDELIDRISDVSILGIRSGTNISTEVLDAAPRLLSIGAFCIGTNQIDLPAASKNGVAVFNAPFSNTRSVVELAIGGIIALARKMVDFNYATHNGTWTKTASGSHEIRGKTLGIVGYGKIGSQLSVLAENLGLKVVFYDVSDRLALGNAKYVPSLKELLRESDFVSVHVDGRDTNEGLFGDEQFSSMKKGAKFINLSRGKVVDETALSKALSSGHIGGALLDVYQEEPKSSPSPFKSMLQKRSNVILMPHVGGATEESQANIGNFVAQKLVQFVNSGATDLSVNLPQLNLPSQKGTHRFIHMHHNVPGTLAKINNIIAGSGANIGGQYLGTKGDTGYVITDLNTTHEEAVIAKLKALPETIRVRVLY